MRFRLYVNLDSGGSLELVIDADPKRISKDDAAQVFALVAQVVDYAQQLALEAQAATPSEESAN